MIHGKWINESVSDQFFQNRDLADRHYWIKVSLILKLILLKDHIVLEVCVKKISKAFKMIYFFTCLQSSVFILFTPSDVSPKSRDSLVQHSGEGNELILHEWDGQTLFLWGYIQTFCQGYNDCFEFLTIIRRICQSVWSDSVRGSLPLTTFLNVLMFNIWVCDEFVN